jgi:hypothetical protein
MARRGKITNLIQLSAVIAVGVFFSYRFSTGWMSANMDITIET